MLLKNMPDRATFLKLAEEFNVIPLCAEILADVETPVSVLRKFEKRLPKETPLFLLESAEGGDRWGRYSFLGVRAKEIVEVFRDEVRVTGEETRKIPHNGDPLNVLREVMKRFRAAELPELPRFFGGLVGYFAYEMVSFQERRVPNKLPAETPMAQLVIPERVIIFDNARQAMTCVQMVFLTDGEDALQAFKAGEAALKEFVMEVETPLGTQAPRLHEAEFPSDASRRDACVPRDLDLRPAYSENDYRRKVLRAKDHIAAGDIIQAVIAQPFQCDAPPDGVTLYRAQRLVNPSPYLFYFRVGGWCLVGSSPETMVKLDRGTAWTRPIAGTRPRGKTPKEDRLLADELLKNEKERAEHLMLVDLGRNDLGRVAATGSVRVTDFMFVERYSHVMHLVSDVACQMAPGKDAWDLFAAVFPAGTLSGAPKVRAMQIIAELEQRPRGFYGGALGYVSFTGDMDLAITIRTAMLENGTLTAFAGAGIVADSVPAEEYRETVNKAGSITRALELVGAWSVESEEWS